MSKYYVKAENSRGKLVTAAQPLMARAELLTLRKDVKSFNSSASVSSQTESVTVTLERALDGQLIAGHRRRERPARAERQVR